MRLRIFIIILFCGCAANLSNQPSNLYAALQKKVFDRGVWEKKNELVYRPDSSYTQLYGVETVRFLIDEKLIICRMKGGIVAEISESGELKFFDSYNFFKEGTEKTSRKGIGEFEKKELIEFSQI